MSLGHLQSEPDFSNPWVVPIHMRIEKLTWEIAVQTNAHPTAASEGSRRPGHDMPWPSRCLLRNSLSGHLLYDEGRELSALLRADARRPGSHPGPHR